MARKLVTIATFDEPAKAHLAKGYLEEEGVTVYLGDETMAGVFWQYGNAIGGVKLQVAAENADRARSLLADHHLDQVAAIPSRQEPQANWTCAKCGTEVDSEFEVCWSCGTSRDGAEDPSFQAEPASREVKPAATVPKADPSDWQSALEPRAASADASNPFVSPRAIIGPLDEPPPLPEEVTDPGDAIARRAALAAVLGAVACPPLLNAYSGVLLLKLGLGDHPLSSRGTRHFYGALVVNLIVCLGAGMYARMIVGH